MPKLPDIRAARTIATTRLFRIEELDLTFANGVEACFERLVGTSAGAVLVVPMQDADTVLLVREYAAGVHAYELALPKGRIEPGESPLAAANRELTEEIGFAAGRVRLLRTLSLAPGYVSHITHVVLAEDLYPKRAEGDEPEPIEVVPWRLSRLDELLAREDVSEARSIAALFMTRELLQRKIRRNDHE